MHNRRDDYTPSKPTNKEKLEIGQAVMVRNHAHQTFEPEYLNDYSILK